MSKNSILAALSTLAPCDVLGGAAWLAAPEYSKGLRLVNDLDERSMELISVQGSQEDVPPIGSSISEGQLHDFEVQYRVADTGRVFARYQINDSKVGWVGDVEFELSYNWDGSTGVIVRDNSTDLNIIVTNRGDSTYAIKRMARTATPSSSRVTAAACR